MTVPRSAQAAEPVLTYPNRFARALFLAMDEVMGRHGRTTVLETAGLSRYNDVLPPDSLARDVSFRALAAANLALDQVYNARGGRGMALRVGRAWFSGGLARFGAMAGCADPHFRALPLAERQATGLHALADVFTHFSDQQCTVSPAPGGGWRFVVSPSAMAYGEQADRPICHPLVGMLQEAMRWFSNGREYGVRETECIAVGAPACVFVITPHPL
jgi:predicted hydrocarbon binding protein